VAPHGGRRMYYNIQLIRNNIDESGFFTQCKGNVNSKGYQDVTDSDVGKRTLDLKIRTLYISKILCDVPAAYDVIIT
jgi:hypothetical protein